jgi:hypothetical protein
MYSNSASSSHTGKAVLRDCAGRITSHNAPLPTPEILWGRWVRYKHVQEMSPARRYMWQTSWLYHPSFQTKLPPQLEWRISYVFTITSSCFQLPAPLLLTTFPLGQRKMNLAQLYPLARRPGRLHGWSRHSVKDHHPPPPPTVRIESRAT